MFELISTYETVQRRDEPMVIGTGDAAAHNPLNPLDARALEKGEWLEHDNNGNFRRGGDNVAGTVDETTRMAFPWYMERGRYDQQGIAGRPGGLGGKATVLYLGAFEFETDMVDLTALVSGSPLTVVDFNFGGLGIVRRCLAQILGAGLTVARVITVDAAAGTIRAIRIYS
ncbi:MAG: hypothetical protein ABH877_04850 [bacterium]